MKNYINNKLPKLQPPPGREILPTRSRDSGLGIGAKRISLKYTGNNIVGIATLHKSNAIPVFSKQEAKDVSAMRR